MNIEDVISSVIGQIAWLPRRGLGSFITVEFGMPHLITREPTKNEQAHCSLRRRAVFVQGEQHLWIQADDWTLRSKNGDLLPSGDPLLVSQGLEILAGQRLLDLKASSKGSEFIFEYGETLILRPDPDPDQTQWSIFWHDAGNASWLSRGALKLEAQL